ncbi:RNA polymerase recycling motor HelD [Paenibacillus radicis (ex Xue et al. 2023)]|uniref:UvrD-helicase domain-containing protein n=1 Tax=Paenibacillus radicis (ex Xue et al. 2023) TaxID=2972489 RepID=A0ABT1YP19_9BACL|nr:RNA polymerase recycling motor HelD [Paenibacillus radicis (ex Xue et al. 2023)]MCR8634930.1 UvrD-helicase domain-containing protein [Paenibacillus radicis (ex Xue et al. 2023)]
MNVTELEWRLEQERVNEVTNKMAGRMDTLEQEAGHVRTEVVNIRKHFWDDVSINVSTHEDRAETYSSMRQQAEVLSERERSYRQAAAVLGKLQRLIKSPYFGRIDFKEEGQELEERIYLGIASYLDEDEQTYLVYDWRAPISSLYYDYGPGSAAFETPVGEIRGIMSLKRQFIIRDRSIRLMFDTGVTIGDELLQQVLSRSSDAQMRSIVATIQKEQNQIIRNDRSRMLVVQGAAGSGKTSAALQRVAYLLYKHRENLQADQMVLFSPNPMFNSYVSTVLPELGEENMQQSTFQEYLEKRLGTQFQVESPFNQMEYVLTAALDRTYLARMSSIRYKASAEYLAALGGYKELLEKEGMIFKPVRFRGRIIASQKAIAEKFYSYDPAIRLPNRVVLLKEWLLKEIAAFEEQEWKEGWVEDRMELLEPEDYLRSYKRMRQARKGKEDTFDDFDKEKELLARSIVNEELKPLRKRTKRLSFVDVRKLYAQLFTNDQLFERVVGTDALPDYWQDICRETIALLEKSKLTYEDATPYLYLQELILGFQTNTSVRHVIVDEAQDYSPFQLEFLKRLFPRSRMTALGDLNQAIYAHSSALADIEPLTALYGPEQTELIRLTRSYRSTQQIVEFTRGMVPGGDLIEPFNRSGERPLVTSVLDCASLNAKVASDIEALQKNGYESIAVICKTAAQSQELYAELSEKLELNLVTQFTPTFEKGTLVIPAYLAKGVEFDAVIIYDASKEQYSRENERKLFYTACTRAMHLLHVYAVGELSPFILTQNPQTYQFEPFPVS